MFVAELQGKIPSKLDNSEDLLTSNVFSFFKYANRNIYLRDLLSGGPFEGIKVSDKDLDEAQFVFWPNYEDGTEPDLVLIVGDYYILFEAKLSAGFGKETATTKGQIERELAGGRNEAQSLGKTFIPVAITAHYLYPQKLLADFEDLKWMNWQKVAMLVLDLIENSGVRLSDYLFALDLYNLLDRKNLRGFLSFNRLNSLDRINMKSETIFFSARSAQYRGDFFGFQEFLADVSAIKKKSSPLFFSKKYFNNLPAVRSSEEVELSLGRKHEQGA